ncbi:MAG: DUF2029 domain-containing protein [Chloroflexi bacterium]|nr:DUF2029 domain-containing protein [Chloroflexota bacterium]
MNSPLRISRFLILVLELGIALSILLFYYLRWGTFENFNAAIDHCDFIFCDFNKPFYIMGENILTVKAPTNGFYYSPFAALLFLPYGQQPRQLALIWWGISLFIGLIGLYVVWQSSMHRTNPSFKLLYLFLLFTAFPVLHNFKWGNISILIFLLIFLSIGLYQSGRWVWSSFWLAFAATVNFYPVLFVLPFLFKRDLKFLIAFGLFILLLAIIVPTAVIGFDPTINFYLEVLKNPQSRSPFFVINGDPRGSTSQYFPRLMLRLLGGTIPEFWLIIVQAASLLLLAGNMCMAWLAANSKLAGHLQWSFLFVFTSIPFVVPTSWSHYFVFLPAFQAWAVFAIDRGGRVLAILKYFILFVSIVLSNGLYYLSFEKRELYAFGGFVFWADLLLMIVACLEWIPRFKYSDFLGTLEQWLPAATKLRRRPSS